MAEPFYIPYDKVNVGDQAQRSSLISEDIVNRFSELIGDTESFHVSEEAASKTVFQKRIAHAVHLASFVSTLIGQELPGWGTIYCSQTYNFYRPVYLEETVTTEVTVLEKLPQRRLRMQTTMLNGDGKVIMDGIAVVKTYQ